MSKATESQLLIGWKKWVGLSLIVVGSLSFFMALSATWLSNTIFSQENFVTTTKSVLLTESNRQAIAGVIVDQALENRPVANRLVGNQATSLVSGLLGSELFSNVYDKLANKTYSYLTTPNRDDVAIDLTAIKQPLSGIVSFAENRGRDVSFDPNQIPGEIVLVESDNVPNISGSIQMVLVLNALFWLITAGSFIAYLLIQKEGRIRRAYQLCFAVALVAVLCFAVGPFIPPAMASFVTLTEARPLVADLTSAFLAQFAPQLWASLLIAGFVALGLSLRHQAKRGALYVTSKITSSKTSS